MNISKSTPSLIDRLHKNNKVSFNLLAEYAGPNKFLHMGNKLFADLPAVTDRPRLAAEWGAALRNVFAPFAQTKNYEGGVAALAAKLASCLELHPFGWSEDNLELMVVAVQMAFMDLTKGPGLYVSAGIKEAVKNYALDHRDTMTETELERAKTNLKNFREKTESFLNALPATEPKEPRSKYAESLDVGCSIF